MDFERELNFKRQIAKSHHSKNSTLFVEVSMFRLPNIPTRRIPIVKEPTITEFQFKDVVKGDFVGSGGFGATFIGQYRGKQVALKELNAREMSTKNLSRKQKL